jgi:hypothetical protein
LSKLVVIGIGAAFVIAAVVVGARSTRPHARPMPSPADTTSSPAETPDPMARPVSVEPAAAPVQPPAGAAPVAVAAATAEPDPGALLDDPGILAMLHDLAGSDPQRSLRLAKAALERFPDSPNAPEFEWNVVKALFNMGRLEDAKDEAQVMVVEYPGTYFTGDVEHHLLHPPPNPP